MVAPEYAPKTVDLDALLTERFGPAVTAIVRGLEREHVALDQRRIPDVTAEDRWTLGASAAGAMGTSSDISNSVPPLGLCQPRS